MKKVGLAIICLWALQALSLSLQATPVKLGERTPVKVAVKETLTSGEGKVGDEIAFELREDLCGPSRELLAKKGAPAYGKLLRTKRRGAFGRPGKLDLTCDYVVAVDGTRIPLRGTETRAQSGKGNVTATVITTVLLGPLGLLVHGRDVTINKGTEFTMYVDADTAVDPDKVPTTDGSASSTTYAVTIRPAALQELAQKISAAIPAPGGQAKVIIGIADFALQAEKDSMQLDKAVGKNAVEDLATALGGLKGFKVVDRTEWDKALATLKVEPGTPVDSALAKNIGSQAGAQFIVTGTISDRGKVVVINARVIETQAGEDACRVSVEVQKP